MHYGRGEVGKNANGVERLGYALRLINGLEVNQGY